MSETNAKITVPMVGLGVEYLTDAGPVCRCSSGMTQYTGGWTCPACGRCVGVRVPAGTAAAEIEYDETVFQKLQDLPGASDLPCEEDDDL